MNIKSEPQMDAGPNYTLFTLYENSQPKKKKSKNWSTK